MSQRTSVIIPCYNSEQYLAAALESVQGQTAPAREIIVVDDGSTTPVRAPASWNGPPLHVIRIPNSGPAGARNRGMAVASGQFVALLDADDTWHPEKIEAQERALDANPAAVGCYTRCAAGPGLFAFGPYPPPDVSDDDFLIMLWYHAFFPPSALMFRRAAIDAVGVFDESLRGPEDVDYYFRLLTLGRFVQVAQPYCLYRQHAGQFTSSPYKKLSASKRARVAAIRQHGDRVVAAGLRRERLWDAYRNDIMVTFYRRQFFAARRLLWDFWTDHPGDLTVLTRAFLALLPEALVTATRGKLPTPALLPHDLNADAAGDRWAREFQRIAPALNRRAPQP